MRRSAADFSAATGSGIDVVHAYAYPLDAAASPIFLGSTIVGIARPDVAGYFGDQYGRTGFGLAAAPLAPGRYAMVVFGPSLVGVVLRQRVVGRDRAVSRAPTLAGITTSPAVRP